MSIEYEKAVEHLKLLRSLENDPSGIFTKLYPDCKNSTDYENFIIQVNMNGVYVKEYIYGILKDMEIFKKCRILYSGTKITVFLPGLAECSCQQLREDDKIMEIDLSGHSYRKCMDSIRNYRTIMNAEYTLKETSLPSYWQCLEKCTLRERMDVVREFKNHESWKYRCITRKISKSVYFLFSKKTDLMKKKKELEKLVGKDNATRNTEFQRKLLEQKEFRLHAPAYIAKINAMQSYIGKYLTEQCGYVKEGD